MKPNADKKPKKSPRKKETVAAVPDPGVRYWRVFGQVHIVKPANADRVRTSRKQVKLAEYIETKTLDDLHEINEALIAKVKRSPYVERVEIWSVEQVIKAIYDLKTAPRKPGEPPTASELLQAELFPLDEIKGRGKELAASPAAQDGVGVPDSQPEATALGRGAQAQDGGCNASVDETGTPCGRLALYTGKDGRRYCAQCWPNYPDEHPLTDEQIAIGANYCPLCVPKGSGLPYLMIPHTACMESIQSKKPNRLQHCEHSSPQCDVCYEGYCKEFALHGVDVGQVQ